MRNVVLLTLLLCCGGPLLSQKVNYDSLQMKYSDEPAVFSIDKEHMHIAVKDDKLSVFSDHLSEICYLKDNAKAYADKSMYYSYFTALDHITAYSLVPKEKVKKFEKIPVTEFSDNNVLSSSVFFDSSKKKSFVFPKAVKGGVGHLEYRETYNDPKFIGVFYFNSYLPVLHSEFSLTFPSNVKVEYTLRNAEKYAIGFSKEEKKGNTIYKWVAKDIAAYDVQDHAPAISYYAPHLILRITQFTHKDGTVEKVLPDVDALYSWYYSLVEKVNSEKNEDLQRIVDSLTAQIVSKDEKAKAIFNWVQNNVKYVAFEDGMGGFVPREAHLICQRRYGDCKDMASIITTMLRAAGLEAHLTWIGSRDIPYTYAQVPMPIVDNHMIAAYKKEDATYVFLDAVGSYTPYGFPTSMIQGKEALVENGMGKYNIVKVPEIDKEKNRRSDSVLLRIEDKVLVGKAWMDCRGYDKLNFVYRMINISEDKYPDILKGYIDKGSNKIELQNVQVAGLNNRDTNLLVQYDFKLPDYAKFVGDEVYVNLFLEKEFKGRNIDIAKRRGIPMESDYKYVDREIVRLEIPKGMQLDYLPASVSYHHALFGFDIKYQQVQGEVLLSKSVYIDYLLLMEENFEAWNTMVKELNKAYNEVVILKKK